MEEGSSDYKEKQKEHANVRPETNGRMERLCFQVPGINSRVEYRCFSIDSEGDEIRSSQSTCPNTVGQNFWALSISSEDAPLEREKKWGTFTLGVANVAALKHSDVATADLECIFVGGEKKQGVDSNPDFSKGSCFQPHKQSLTDSVSKSCKATFCSKNPPSAGLPSVEVSHMNQSGSTGVIQTSCNQSAFYSYKVSEPSNTHGPMSTMTSYAQQQQHGNSTGQSVSYSNAAPSGSTHSEVTRLNYRDASNIKVEPVDRAPTSHPVHRFLPENGTESDPKILALRQLEKLRDLSTKRHHVKMEQLSLAYEIELIQLNMKHGMMIDDSSMEVLQRKKDLLVLHDKMYREQILDEGLAICGLSNDPKEFVAQTSEVESYNPSKDPKRKPKSNNPAWKYGFLPDLNNKRIVQCILCDKKVSSITRLKEHLSGGSKDVIRCPKTTSEISAEMHKTLMETRRKKPINFFDMDEVQMEQPSNPSNSGGSGSNVPSSSGTMLKRTEAGFFQVPKAHAQTIATQLSKIPEEITEERHQKKPKPMIDVGLEDSDSDNEEVGEDYFSNDDEDVDDYGDTA